ncbi:MAG: Wzz/FepE/Etk N-terminal domain-containing protein [Candidatus Marinimicrobia bacterium]|nr:Wzz/FepE/Etk N-terminal domain-containing protein [Candidatus Neomarinimicrobiota bacterium]
MSSRGVTTLADISRALDTTPQAVSNWKARNQVPHHIAAKLNLLPPTDSRARSAQPENPQFTPHYSPFTMEENTISLSDILLTMAEQLKVIVVTTFISVFLTFTYVQFIQVPQYVSWATVLLPENKAGNLGGLAGLASQFGVNVPMGSTADLSSPSLYPELLRSRTFAEKILDKEFYLDKYSKKLSLLAILTYGDEAPKFDRDKLIANAVNKLNGGILAFDQDPNSTFSVIKVTAEDPFFAKKLADVVLAELESLNRFYKSQTVSEKTSFIESRISSVEGELETSEKSLKDFNERNRQISSPALQLDQERLARDVEIQKGIYLTLKQQLELAKIEEVQESSVVQVLDRPAVAISSSNKNLVLSVILSFILGIGLGIMIGFVRSYLDNSNIDERKKLRRVKHFFKKKIKDIFIDSRIAGILSGFMLIGLPFFLGYESKNPVFFGMYSAKLMLLNIVYIAVLLISLGMFIRNSKKK